MFKEFTNHVTINCKSFICKKHDIMPSFIAITVCHYYQSKSVQVFVEYHLQRQKIVINFYYFDKIFEFSDKILPLKSLRKIMLARLKLLGNDSKR